MDLADKEDFYGSFLQHWFIDHPYNNRLVDQIKDTFMYGGYYRADVDAHISILAVNTLYMNKKNNATTQGSEIPDMLAWMRA